MSRWLMAAGIAVLVVWCCRTHAAEPVPTATINFAVVDLQGRTHELRQNDRQRVRVFVFLSTECPIANSYAPTLNALAERLGAESRCELFGVLADATVTRTEARRHFVDEFKLKFPVLFDASGQLAALLKPTHVPEAFVVNADGHVAYRGAIDNAWVALGRRRPQAERTFLADAITAALQNKQPEARHVPPVGCHFNEEGLAAFTTASDSNPATAKTDAPSFARDIAPIVFARCTGCHRPGQVAPFPLTNYDEVAKHAEQMVTVTQQRIMPPWMPAGSSSKPPHDKPQDSSRDVRPTSALRFVGERWLTDSELALIKAWVDSGAARGNSADLPPLPEFAEGWQLGEPDLVVKMQAPFRVRADGPDLLQNFVIPLDIPEDKLVSAIEFHPGNKRVVHHAVLFLDDKGHARKLDAATPEPGYSNFGGPGFAPSGALGGWSVGNTPRHLPNEMGRYLKKGSDLVVQVHYHPTGKEEVDQSEIGIYFVKKPVAESLRQPAKLVGSIWLANYEMDIAAGEKNYRRSTTYVLPRDVRMVGVVPHMHLLGKAMRVTAELPPTAPNAPRRESEPTDSPAAREPNPAAPLVLIDVPNWNYNWQDEYYYERPFLLPNGTRLRVEATYDNSADNPSNPSSPPQRVTWGDETADEMLFCFFLLTADKTEDLIHTIYDNLGHDLRQPRAKK